MQRLVVAVALICPLGALAVEPAIGSETDGRKTAGVAGWAADEEVAAESWRPGRSASRERAADPANTAGRTYRYGQREPALEQLPVTGRVPAIVDASAREY